MNIENKSGFINKKEYYELIDLIPQIFFEVDTTGKIILVNQKAYQIFGYSREDVKAGLSIFNVIHPDDQKRAKENFSRIIQGENFPDGIEYTLLTRDGAILNTVITSRVIYKDNRPIGIRGIITDITILKKKDEELDFAKFVIENAAVAIFWIERNGIILYANQKACLDLDFTRDEFLKMRIQDIFEKDFKEHFIFFTENRHDKKSFSFESNYITKAGKVIPVDVDIASFEYENREVFFLFVKDILKRKKAEKELRDYQRDLEEIIAARTEKIIKMNLEMQSEVKDRIATQIALEREKEKAEHLLKMAPSGIMTVDINHNITNWNRTAEEITGWSADEMIGKKCFFIKDDLCKKCKLDDVSGDYESYGIEFQITRKDGSVAFLSKNMSILHDPSGEIIGAVESFIDITEKKAMIERLLVSEKMSAVGQLAAGVSHEFNNILAVIKGNIDLARISDYSKEDFISLLDIIDTEIKQGTEIVSNISAFSRPVKPEIKRNNIHDIIDYVIRSQEKNLALENIVIELNYNFKGNILADAVQLRQVFLNLFINARHAMRPYKRGIIRIKTERVGNNLEITFADTGIGIAPEIKKKIFEPFFTTKGALASTGFIEKHVFSEIEGTGLGLSLVHRIISEHNGSIEVESELKKGTTFKILLPAEKVFKKELQ